MSFYFAPQRVDEQTVIFKTVERNQTTWFSPEQIERLLDNETIEGPVDSRNFYRVDNGRKAQEKIIAHAERFMRRKGYDIAVRTSQALDVKARGDAQARVDFYNYK